MHYLLTRYVEKNKLRETRSLDLNSQKKYFLTVFGIVLWVKIFFKKDKIRMAY
jgi:hypothetical protein